MRRPDLYIPGRLICSVILILVFASCKNGLTITTISPTTVTASTALIGGEVKLNSNYKNYERGICYSTKPEPTERDQRIESGRGPGSFKSVLTELSANTTYYVRAYVVYHSEGEVKTEYGNEVSFKTPAATLASVSTTNESAEEYGGYALNDGGSPIIEQGICYKITPNPTIADNKLTAHDLNKFGVFVFRPDFKAGTIYYVRAFATNHIGTAYGKEVIAGALSFVCSGNAWKGATSYDPTKSGIHPVISNFKNSYPSEWSSATLEQAELLVCKTQKAVYYKTCYYTDDKQVKRYYDEETYTIREVITGRIIANKIFRGPKEDCDETIRYDQRALGSFTRTTSVDNKEIENWIKGFVVK